MKNLVTLVLCLGFSLPMFAADKNGSEVLDRWVGGTWVGDGQFLDTAYSSAAKVSGATKCAWSRTASSSYATRM